MWGLRQIFLAAGVPKDDLPFRSAGRLKPDAASSYEPPNFDSFGNIPPGQKWLDLLVQERKIVQVFGVHNDHEADKILEEWQPNKELEGWPCYLKPWLWQPFYSVHEFLFEYPDIDLERKYDPCTRMVCDRKTFLNLQPMSEHSSSHWEELKRLHICAMPVGLYFEKTGEYFDMEKSATYEEVLEKGHEVMLNNQVGCWGDVSIAVDEWWLPVYDGTEHILKKMGDGDESGSHFRALRDMPYYQEASKQRCPDKVKSDVTPLRRGQDIEVLYLDLDGKWAKVKHHENSVYFKSYWMPLVTRNKNKKTLKPFYLSQVTELESYIGSKIAFYFTFTATYISFLLLLLMTGVLFALIQGILGWYESEKLVMWNALLVVMWAALFRQRWMRKATELAYMWNVRNVEQWEPPMAEFLKRNVNLDKKPHPVTGLMEPFIPPWKRRWWYLLSIIVTGLMATLVVIGMYWNVRLRDEYAKKDTLLKLAFGIENAVSIAVMDVVFAEIAERLNWQENHRTKSSLQNSAIIKSFVFRFINGLSGLVITVFRTPEGVCDCHVDCDPVCKNSGPFDIQACNAALGEIRACIARSRQQDLVVQLTTMLVIQSLLSILFEKIIPRAVLLSRQEKKKKHNDKAEQFPQTLGCLAISAVKYEGLFHVTRTKDTYGYSVVIDDVFKPLKKYSRQYGGWWEDADGHVYRVVHDEEAHTLSIFLKDSAADDVTIADIPIHGQHQTKGKRQPETLHDPTLCTEFPITRNGFSWTSIHPTPNSFNRLEVVTPAARITLNRTQEIRNGMLSSEPTPLTLSVEDRREAGIPKDATHFMWVYGLAQKLIVENEKGEPVELIDALGIFAKHPDVLAAMHAVLFGAYLYLNEHGSIVALNSVEPSEQGLAFEKPVPWKDSFTKNLWRKGRFRPVTLSKLKAEGALWYCWLNPGEELQSKAAGQPLWMPSKSGAFIYLFGPEPKTPHHYTGALPPEPPEPHPKNRLFSVRRRQLDSTMAVILETMKPPTSEEKEFDDYTMMMLQFAYVVCFASVGPMTPFVAIITGSIELHTDLLKFLKLTQRPEAQKASGIGAWLTLLTAIIYISIPINALVVIKGYGWRSYAPDSSHDTQVIGYLGMLGVGVLVVTIIRFVVNPTAAWVVQHELRKDYEKLQEITTAAIRNDLVTKKP
eukprot:TRINITY_DN13844_c0_g1_i2.p1 TRINITY_DN13844_c0_g1~~TRINITY_DN13844_c0_g1_i2.p1  ORF type:complete len:1312 (+),score=393.11 TRINITY_DN13844_c0_g1_i2:450-3938(+)